MDEKLFSFAASSLACITWWYSVCIFLFSVGSLWQIKTKSLIIAVRSARLKRVTGNLYATLAELAPSLSLYLCLVLKINKLTPEVSLGFMLRNTAWWGFLLVGDSNEQITCEIWESVSYVMWNVAHKNIWNWGENEVSSEVLVTSFLPVAKLISSE